MIELLKTDVQAWNAIDLRSADLRSADLSGANLSGADLREANLREAVFSFTGVEYKVD